MKHFRDFGGAVALLVSASLGMAALPVEADAAKLTIAQNYDPKSLWPNASTAQEEQNTSSLVVEPLFWSGPDNKLMPVLATGYELLSDTEILVTLREGVPFTNGEPVNADVLVFNLGLFVNTEAAPAYAIYSKNIESFEKKGDYQVLIRMRTAYPAVALLLSQIYLVPPAYWQSVGKDGFGLKPVGTGPFMFEEWVRDDKLVLKANPNYWGKAPANIDEIELRPVPNDMTRVAGVMSGEFDIATNIPIASTVQIEASPGAGVVGVPSFRNFFIFLATRDKYPGPVQDLRVRQALNYAIDRQALVEHLFGGHARVLNGQVIRPDQIGYNPDVTDYPYDPQKAKELLAEAGYANGLDLVFKSSAGRYAQDREVGEALTAMWKDVGINIKLEQLESGEFLRQMGSGELEPLGFMGAAFPDDPQYPLTNFNRTSIYSYSDNEKLDELLNAGAVEMDTEKRAAIYRQAVKLIHDEALTVFLYATEDVYGVSDRVKNFAPRGDQRWAIYGMSIEQ